MARAALSTMVFCIQLHNSSLETMCYHFLLVDIACRLSEETRFTPRIRLNVKNIFWKKNVPVIFCRNRRNPSTRCFHLHPFCHFSSYQLPKFSKFHQAVDNFFLRELSSTFDVLLQIGSKVLAKQMFVGNRKFGKHQQSVRHLNSLLKLA